jgi:hypothetical protein
MDWMFLIIAIELFVIIIYKIFTKKQLKKYANVKISLFIAIIFYFVFNLYFIGHGKYLEYKLNSFDLDGDGLFSGLEITPEQEKAMEMVIWDTGRTFAPITTGIFSIVNFLALILLTKSIDIFINKFTKTGNY